MFEKQKFDFDLMRHENIVSSSMSSYSYISGVAMQLGIGVVEMFVEDSSIAINGILIHHQWHRPLH